MKAKYILTILALITIVVGCKNEDITREPSPLTNPSSSNVYFSTKNNTNPVLAIDQDTFSIKIGRKLFDKEQTVSLTAGNSYGDSITIPSQVKFNAGDSIKSVIISTKNLLLMKKYHVAISVDQDQTKPYTKQSVYPRVELNILKEDYAQKAKGKYSSDFFEDEWEATLEYSPSTKLYRFKDCWMPGYNYFFKVSDTGVITQSPAKIETGYVHKTYGMVSATADPTKSKYDNQTKTYTFVIKWTVSAGSFGVYNDTFLVETSY